MHVRETVEVAGLLCLNARSLLQDCPRISERAMTEYWAASRCRLDEWGRAVRSFENHTDTPLGFVKPVVEEVLIGQVLTRTLAALAVAHDRRRGLDESGPIARNVVAAHTSTAARVRWLLQKRDALAAATRLNSRVERWTDLLLGYVAPLCGTPAPNSPAGHAIEFAFDPSRVQEFAYDASTHVNSAGDFHRCGPLLTASLRAAFHGEETQAPNPNPNLNRRVAGAALGLFGPEAFDSHGLLRSTLVSRIEQTADDTLGLVEQLFIDTPPADEKRLLPPPRFS